MTAGASTKRKPVAAPVEAKPTGLVDTKGLPLTKVRVLTAEEIDLAERYAQASLTRLQARYTDRLMSSELSRLTIAINALGDRPGARAGIIFAEALDLMKKVADESNKKVQKKRGR